MRILLSVFFGENDVKIRNEKEMRGQDTHVVAHSILLPSSAMKDCPPTLQAQIMISMIVVHECHRESLAACIHADKILHHSRNLYDESLLPQSCFTIFKIECNSTRITTATVTGAGWPSPVDFRTQPGLCSATHPSSFSVCS